MDVRMVVLGISAVVLCLLPLATGADPPAVEYKQECIVDKTKEASDEGNYRDCTGEDHVSDGSTDCCDVDGVIDCCDKAASWRTLILICVAIGVTTVVLALLCFWIYWCDDQMCPWIGPYKRKWDEKTGMCKKKVCCLCVGEDDEDEEAYKKQRKQQQQQQQQRAARSRGILDEEERPESTLSGSTAEDEPGAGPADGGDAIDVQTDKNDMPPEYRAEVKDDFFNF